MIAAQKLAEVFVEVADTLVDDFDLIEFLQRLATNTSELFDVGAAGLLLIDQHGRLQVMAASDERTQMLELFQLQAHEGPCQECFRRGDVVIGADLTQATGRWPRFAPHAVSAGYRAVHDFPMRLRGEVIGALNLFSASAGEMDATDVRLVQALTDVATIALLQERAIRRGELLAEQLQGALSSRIVIEQAKGALAQIHDCSTDQAFDLLRRYARARGRLLSDVGRDVTRNPEDVSALTSPRPNAS
ncbi:MAG: GAF and ANTAR domain-containing protein [Nocardioidaceae bacterium]